MIKKKVAKKKVAKKRLKALNIIEVFVNGELHKCCKVPDAALDEFLQYIHSQMDECPHGSNWEDCSECEGGKFEQ